MVINNMIIGNIVSTYHNIKKIKKIKIMTLIVIHIKKPYHEISFGI